MSKESRKRALEAICDAKALPFLSNAPLMAVVELVQVLDDAGLLVDPDVADLDPDEPIPYRLAVQPPRDVPPAPEPEQHILAGSPCFGCGQTLNDSGLCTNPRCEVMPF